LIHSKKISPEEIFEFSESWKGNVPLVAIPTTYYSVKVDELINHKIKMVIYANQTLRAVHLSLSRLLQKMSDANSMDEVQDQMSSMEDIFQLQETYDLKSQEKSIEEKLRKLGYIA
jgi:phosphoenolpyruvate phosphomutase